MGTTTAVAVPPPVDRARRVALAIHLVGMPVLGDLALDAVEERREPPALGVERGLVAIIYVAQGVLRAAPDRPRELLLAGHQ